RVDWQVGRRGNCDGRLHRPREVAAEEHRGASVRKRVADAPGLTPSQVAEHSLLRLALPAAVPIEVRFPVWDENQLGRRLPSMTDRRGSGPNGELHPPAAPAAPDGR